MSHLYDDEVLKLNSRWIPIGVVPVRQAFMDAYAGATTFLRFHEGYPTPYRIQDWVNLPVGDKEPFIATQDRYHTLRKVAVPRVMICVNFDGLIAKEQKLNSLEALAKHYDYTCAVTGKKLKPNEYSREHVRPLSKGGRRDPTNEVLMDRSLNNRRGNRSYRKFGHKKPRVKPPPRPKMPFHTIVNRHRYPEWYLFPGIVPPHDNSVPARSD